MANIVYAKDYINQIAKVKSADMQDSEVSTLLRGSAGGAVAGGIVGLAIAYKQKKNLLWFTFIGSVIGGIAARTLLITKS